MCTSTDASWTDPQVLVRPCAFFSMFLVTRPRSFSLKSKKKKKGRLMSNQTKSCWFGIAIGDGDARFACFTCSWLDVFTVIARKREKNFLLLRCVMEEDDKQHLKPFVVQKTWCLLFMHICQSFEQISTPRLAMIKWQSLASELRYLVLGHGKPKATMPSVKIAKRGLCWE